MDAPRLDRFGAFAPHGLASRPPCAPGALDGLKIAVKDLFDWAGLPTGAGNPDWLASHPVPERDADAVARLSAQGATLWGKTVTDELAYSLAGRNVHYGTPVNPAAPDRLPGGSSSGSAVAVAAGLADAALGTDTGGSVRVPASQVGVYGLRTSHGAVGRGGLVPLAPSFDTVGWFARDIAVMERLGAALLGQSEVAWTWRRIAHWPALAELADRETQAACAALCGTVKTALGLERLELDGFAADIGSPEDLRACYVAIQGREAWQTHGAWIDSRRPNFAPDIAQRFAAASRVGDREAAEAARLRERFAQALRRCLSADSLLALPTTSGPAPLAAQAEADGENFRRATMRLTCVAGLAGLPQLHLPFKGSDGLPRGVSMIGPAGSDRALLALARVLEDRPWRP